MSRRWLQADGRPYCGRYQGSGNCISVSYTHLDVYKRQGKENTRLEAAKSFQFPFVTYEINKSYSTDNCPYSALIKIDREIWGNKLIITDCNDENFDGAEGLYDGIACLYGLKNHLTAYITGIDVTNLSSLSKSIKKLHEHRCLLLLSLSLIHISPVQILTYCGCLVKTVAALSHQT